MLPPNFPPKSPLRPAVPVGQMPPMGQRLPVGQMSATGQVPPARPTYPTGQMSSSGQMPSSSQMPPINVPSQQSSPNQTTSPPVQKAEVQQSVLRFLPFVLGGLLVLVLVFFIFRSLFGSKGTSSPSTGVATGNSATSKSTGSITNNTGTSKSTSSITLTYWGLWEPTAILQEVLTDFESSHPGVKVNYQMQSYQDYRDRLQNAIAQNRGPDVFRFNAAWTPMLQNELSPMPDTVYNAAEFSSTFYPAAAQMLTMNSKIDGVPLMYEGLALLYNDDALRAADAQPPKTWHDLKDLATKLTIRSGDKIQRAGMAIGNATNVDNFSDILALLIFQNGGDPSNPTSQNVSDALTFYTNFMKTDKVWDDSLPNSTMAFARENVAMIMVPSWRIHDIKALNPNLKFTVIPVPQLTSTKVTFANFWAEGVSSQSNYKTESWQLLKYMSSADVLRKLYSSASKNRAFGELYPRVDMAGELASDPYANAYLSDAPYAKGWYMSSATHDNGLNDEIIKYYQDAVTAMLGNTDAPTALGTVAQGVSQILRQYGLASGQ